MAPEERYSLCRFFKHLEEATLVLLVGAMILLAFAQIILRNFFSLTLLWGDPLVRHLVLWTSFLGASIATHKCKHIKIDALLRFFPPRNRALLEGLSGIFSALVCGLLTWISLQFIGDEKEHLTHALGEIPTWKLQLIFPISFSLMGLKFLFQVVRNRGNFRRRGGP